MRFYADLHLHSHFSRATSKQLNLEHLSKWAQLKGIRLVGTGDFVHPGWLEELQKKLEPAEEGFFQLKPEYAHKTQAEVPAACVQPVRFMLTAEISNIYKFKDKVRKIHNVIFVPSFEAAEKIQARLDRIGNIRSDGRPILGLDSRDLLEITLEADPLAFLIPAHIWTPWFSVLGSKGGFDRMEDCFRDLTSHIFAVETGLSSDPPMNWRLEQLDRFILVSNSDAHSPQKLAREATVFDTEFNYPSLYRSLADPEDPGVVGTVEFFPEEGKYHFDGHRKCGTRMHPRETIANQGLCPECGKPVTVGVMARVEELATRPEGEKPPRWRPYYSLVPLPEIIAEAKNVGANSKTVQNVFQSLLAKLGNELHILQEVDLQAVKRLADELVAEGIRRVRAGEIHIAAGYDGEYGTIQIFTPKERELLLRQSAFFASPESGAPPSAGRGAAKASATTSAGPVEPAPVSTAEAVMTEAAVLQDTAHLPSEAAPASSPHSPAEAAAKSHYVSDVQLGMQLPDDLNAAQWRAVTHTGSHLLIVAGPGTGKTHTLTHRIAHVAQCFAPSQDILALTFTNKAAEEMQDRLRKRLGEKAGQITAGTFHSFCLQFLRKFGHLIQLPENFAIASDEDKIALLQQLWPQAPASEIAAKLEQISRWKTAANGRDAPTEVEAYNQALRKAGLLDFDDLLLETLKLLKNHANIASQLRISYRYIFVDEYQDINALQHALLQELVQDGVLLTAIGDPNQAIYGFRGADVGFFTRFQQDYPGAKILYLAENYRSAGNLLTASSQVIGKAGTAGVPALIAKIYLEGRLIVYEAPTEKAEGEYVVHQIEQMVGGTSMFSQDSGRVASETEATRSFGDIAVLFRLNRLREPLVEALGRHGIPFQNAGDKALINWPGVRELVTAIRLADGQTVSPEALSKALIFAAKGLGETRASNLLQNSERPLNRIALQDLQQIAGNLDDFPSPARQGFRAFVDSLEELQEKLQHQGLQVALQHFVVLQEWGRIIAAEERFKESWQRLVRMARLHQSVKEFLDYLMLQSENDGYQKDGEKVSLLTLHAAKGLEFPVVFIIGCEEGVLPYEREGMVSDLDEERRLFYVGMTRAQETLYLLRSKKRSLFGKFHLTRPSRFLADIEERLKYYETSRKKAAAKKDKKPVNQLDLFS